MLSGWGVNGQVAAALADDHDRRALYAGSVRTRTTVFFVVVPLAVVVAVAVVLQEHLLLGAAMIVSTAMSGMSLSWLAIGSARAGWIAGYELLPRLIGISSAALLIGLTGEIWVYPFLTTVSVVIGLVLFHRRVMGWWLPPRRDGSAGTSLSRRQRYWGGALSISGASYAVAPLPVASALESPGTPELASTDRLYRYALYAITTLSNALHQWVLGAQGDRRTRAQRSAFLLHVALGLTGLAAASILGPGVGTILFGPAVAPSHQMAAFYGLAFLFVAMSTPIIRNSMLPAEQTASVLAVTSVASIVGISGMIIFGSSNATYVALCLAASEGLTFLGVVLLALAWRTRLRTAGNHAARN